LPKGYRYAGEVPRLYPGIPAPEGGSLVANPGDVMDFDVPPPGLWVPVDDKPAKAAKAEKAGD